MEERAKELYDAAVKAWGKEFQLDMAQEECGELITAISHFKRGRLGGLYEMVCEAVDVQLLTEQIMSMFSSERQWAALRAERLEKLAGLIRSGK